MKKIILILMCALALAGCDDTYKEQHYPAVPAELKDCKFFTLENSKGSSITVARCPNSTTTTTYKSGKSTRAAVVVDGVTYEAKEQ